MIVFVYMFSQREYDLYFYVKRDCLLFSVNVKLFFEFSVIGEKATELLLRESVFIRGIGDPLNRVTDSTSVYAGRRLVLTLYKTDDIIGRR